VKGEPNIVERMMCQKGVFTWSRLFVRRPCAQPWAWCCFFTKRIWKFFQSQVSQSDDSRKWENFTTVPTKS